MMFLLGLMSIFAYYKFLFMNFSYSKATSLFTALIIGTLVHAQGLHFSYIDFAPQAINPGNIGGFLGSYRGAVIYRDQYNNSTQVKGYKTIELGVDVPIIRGFRKQDWIGVGMSMDVDKRGTFALTDRHTRMGVSYHLGLDPKQVSVLSVGLQINNIKRSFTGPQNGIYTSAQILSNGGNDPDLEKYLNALNQSGIYESQAVRDIGLGLVFTNNTKTSSSRVGLSTYGFLSDSAQSLVKLPFKVIGFGSFVNQISKSTSIEPTALFQYTKYGTEVMVNAKVGYKYNKDKNDKIKAGLGFRTGTASAIFLLGGEVKGVNYGLSFDLPFSGYADAIGSQYAFELGASYIGFLKKTPKPKPVLTCPRI
jgi:hypothetical protein